MLNAKIVDGHGSGEKLKINPDGSVNIIRRIRPPTDDNIVVLPFRQYFTLNGEPDGDNDMRVAGTTTSPVSFYIDADDDYDIYIQTISFLISDSGATLNKFGNITALADPCRLYWTTQEAGDVIIDDTLSSNFDFVRLCSGEPSFGSGNDAFRANNVVGTSEAFIPVLDTTDQFGMEWGFRIRKGSQERIFLQVRDDTTGVDAFNIVGYGIKI